ncbi:glutaredoxin 2 [Serratia plymuthica]|jgi:glutaredoxin 2|uniref:Glutaredoxin 2 n=1 Tax=Serratia plymuthica TaxID=82996 RepID=A0A318P5N1_SERPL|nr:glutaredoxin 2 [Serratia plymuthica]AGO55614.1 glutaredoxin-2 [Serratia plymuthica 4Rx13]AHY07836.1 glutaredoxin [Serratia plymuthica]MBL3523298.1 glutaredoxin 2 [Serratia plymuthica]MEB6538562.1 glutaredoxin 2 [Serratia plymuthica]OJT43823.1 glutaredoxin, GrxB family [Serratia plymuthica]
MKLFIYDHCPFCVKARMIFGLKNLPVRLVTLLSDDEATPISMIGKKMAPILQKDDGSYLPESMDIVRYVDNLDGRPLLTGKTNPAIADWLQRVGGYSAKLLLPRIANADFEEFATDSARQYFTHKKQASIGDFSEHLANSADLIAELETDLQALSSLIVTSDAVNGSLSEDDIQLFPLLRSLSIVAGVTLPENVEAYRNRMAQLSDVPLLLDMEQ